jgi:predicted nucleotide-binding protein
MFMERVNMTRDYVASLLNQNKIRIEEEKRMSNNLGTVLRTSEGCIVNIFDSGIVNCQGKNKESVEALLKTPSTIQSNRKVFVVYGHDMNARTQLEAMLRRWDLEPLIIDQLVSSGNTIIEKLEEYTDKVDFGIVLATPDDIGYSKNNEDMKKYRVRQNVVLELGMLLAKVGRSKVAILLSKAEDMEKPSDIDGLIYIPFKGNVEETKVSLAKEMQRNGYSLDISKL